MKRIHIHITEQQLAKIQKLAKDGGLKLAEHIRRAIDEYLRKKP